MSGAFDSWFVEVDELLQQIDLRVTKLASQTDNFRIAAGRARRAADALLSSAVDTEGPQSGVFALQDVSQLAARALSARITSLEVVLSKQYVKDCIAPTALASRMAAKFGSAATAVTTDLSFVGPGPCDLPSEMAIFYPFPWGRDRIGLALSFAGSDGLTHHLLASMALRLHNGLVSATVVKYPKLCADDGALPAVISVIEGKADEEFKQNIVDTSQIRLPPNPISHAPFESVATQVGPVLTFFCTDVASAHPAVICLENIIEPWNAAIVLRTPALQSAIAEQLPAVALDLKNQNPYTIKSLISLRDEIVYHEGQPGSFDFKTDFHVEQEGGDGNDLKNPEYTMFMNGTLALRCDVSLDGYIAKFHVTKVDIAAYSGDIHYKESGIQASLDKIPGVRDSIKQRVSDTVGNLDKNFTFDLGKDTIESGYAATLKDGVVLYLNLRNALEM